jgi:transposase
LILPGLIEAGDRVPSNLPIDGHNFRRVEVLTGTRRRRRWTDEEKAAIVAKSQAPGAQASEIALRYGLHRNQLYGWRRDFGLVDAMAEAGGQGPGFVPLMADDGSGAAVIEIEVGGAIVRVRSGVELGLLGKVLRLLKAMR